MRRRKLLTRRGRAKSEGKAFCGNLEVAEKPEMGCRDSELNVLHMKLNESVSRIPEWLFIGALLRRLRWQMCTRAQI